MKKLLALSFVLFVSSLSAGPGSGLAGYFAAKSLLSSSETVNTVAPIIGLVVIEPYTGPQTALAIVSNPGFHATAGIILTEGIALTVGFIGAILPLP